MELMEKLVQFQDKSSYDCNNIAEKLVGLSGLDNNGILGENLADALYQIRAMAANPYNKDYWRVLYNVLLVMAGAKNF